MALSEARGVGGGQGGRKRRAGVRAMAPLVVPVHYCDWCVCSSRPSPPPIPPGGTAAAQGSLQPLLFACRLREHSEREQSMQAELERQERKKLLIARERLAFHRHRLERERMERERLERERRRVEHERRREQERIHHEREELRRQQELRYEQERRPAVRRPYDYGR